MLLYAASYDGQGAIAMRAGKDYAKLTGESFYQVLTLMRFGRFDEVLQVTNRPKPEIQGGALGLRAGLRAPQAGRRRLRQRSIWRASRRRPTHRRRCSASTPAKNLLGDRGRHPRGRDAADGRRPRPARSRRSSAPPSTQDALVYDEPEPLPFSACHWLGAALARSEAVRRGREGLSRRAQGSPAQRLVAARPASRRSRARASRSPEVDADLAASWSRSDTWIRSSRF